MHVKSWCCSCRLRYLSPLIFNILITDSSYCFSAVFSHFTSYYLGCKAVGCLTNAQYNLACDQASQWGKEGEKQKQKQKKMARAKISAWIHSPILLFNYVFCLFSLFTWEPDSRLKLTLNNKIDTAAQKSAIVGQMFWKLGLSCALIFVQNTFPLVTSQVVFCVFRTVSRVSVVDVVGVLCWVVMTDTHVEFKFVLFSLACFSSETLKMQTFHFFVSARQKGSLWSLAFLAETVETE